MKKKLFVIAASMFICFFSFKTFAQVAPGDSGDGSGDPVSFTFKRNNGNGTAGGEAEIRVSFKVLPEHLPLIAEIVYEGSVISGIVMGAVDPSPFEKKGY